MASETFSLRTSDALRLFGRAWLPPGAPRAAITLVHGLGEHSGRYEHVAAALNAAGFALLGADLRGHGQSEGKRGYIPSWDALLDDVSLALAEVRRRLPGLPLFLYGHSLGGEIVLSYALQKKPRLAGVIASAPMLRLGAPQPPLKLALGRLLNRVAPSFVLPNGLDLRGLSHDQAVISAYSNDPLVHDRLSARLGVSMLVTGSWLLEHAHDFRLPLLLIHGSGDPLVSPEATRVFAQQAPGDVTLALFDGLLHEAHNEPQRAQVVQCMVDWLQARLLPPASG